MLGGSWGNKPQKPERLQRPLLLVSSFEPRAKSLSKCTEEKRLSPRTPCVLGLGPTSLPPAGEPVSPGCVWLWTPLGEQEGDRVWGSLTCGGQGHRSPEGGSRLAPGSSRTSPALCGTRLVAADPTRKAAPPEGRGRCVGHRGPRGPDRVGAEESQRGQGAGEQQSQASGSLKTRVGRRRWYLQILGSPLHVPAVGLQGRLALLCGHPMHHGLQLGIPTHRSAPVGPIPLGPSDSRPPHPTARPDTHHLDLICWPCSLWPVPWAGPL